MESLDPKLLPVYQQLQTSYRIVRECNEAWRGTLKQCKDEIDSVQNLVEQYTCSEQANVSHVLSHSQIPDIKEKLLYKISSEIDKKLTKLHNLVKSFKDIHEKVSKQYGFSLNKSKNLPLDMVTMATETVPAVSDMVEWLDDLDTMLHHQYCAKKYLLDTFDVQKFESQNFVQKWNAENTETTEKMDNVLCYVQFLMEDT